MNITASDNPFFQQYYVDTPPAALGNCTASTPSTGWTNQYYIDPTPPMALQQEGNNPMCYNKATPIATSSLSALSISMPDSKSDEMTQREWLLSELSALVGNDWRYDSFTRMTHDKLREMFNMNAPEYPEGSQTIIDAFKNGKVVIDQTKVDLQTAFLAASEDDRHDLWREGIRERYYGITFTDLPVADKKGYVLASEAFEKAKLDTKRKIMIGSPADGLAALMALESWTYTPVTLH